MAIVDPGPFISRISGPTSGSQYKRHKHHKGSSFSVGQSPPHTPSTTGEEADDKCPCKNFTEADELWQLKSIEDKIIWNEALKAPYLSGYDLWMKETLTLFGRGEYAPDTPSPSGGFSTRFVCAGEECPPPTVGKAPPPILPGTDCPNCPGITPLYFWATFPTMGWGPWGCWTHEQTYKLTQVPARPCEWRHDENGRAAYLVKSAPLAWDFHCHGDSDCECNAYWIHIPLDPACTLDFFLEYLMCACPNPFECEDWDPVHIKLFAPLIP